MSNKRTGASVRHTPSNCPSRVAIACGFTEEQAARMIKIRRVLPFSEDHTKPYIDARKLWLYSGKPQGKFADWVRRDIKPLADRTGNISQIREILTTTQRRPRKDYLLSRYMAAVLAMMADTKEGDEVRNYFIDMETLALKLAERTPLRVALIVDNDNAATHYLRKHNADKVKKGGLSRSEALAKSTEQERSLKSLVCEVLTGCSPRAWRDTHSKGIRDVLDTSDLALYANAYTTAVCVLKAGRTRQETRTILLPSFENKIDRLKYGVSPTEF